MDPMKLPKSVAEAMAEDIRKARYRLLRRITVEEAYFLMTLREKLLNIAHQNWIGSLANRYERGQHHLSHHLGIDPSEAQEVADEMAEDMRDLHKRVSELLVGDDPLTVEELRQAEDIFARHGIQLPLVDRSKVDRELYPN